MKKITIYNTAITLALGLSVSAFTACESLDQGNLSELAESNLPQSDEDAKALVNAVYAADIELATTYMYLIDLPTETTVSGENPNGGGGMLGLLSWDGSNSYLTKLWQISYTAIARANDVIAKLEALPAGVSEKIARQVVGEAKFLRAYYLNYAVQLWGPVPIVTTVGGGVNAVRNSETTIMSKRKRN